MMRKVSLDGELYPLIIDYYWTGAIWNADLLCKTYVAN